MAIIPSFSSGWQGAFQGLGFGHQLPSLSRIGEIQQDFLEICTYWSNERLLTVMGTLNAYVYRATIATKAIKKRGDRHYVTERLVAIATQGIEAFNLTQQAICTYLKAHWQGASCGKTTVWKIRDLLVGLGIFEYQKQAFKPGEPKRQSAPDVENFDLIKALILYGVLENIYCYNNREQGGFDSLPKHKGALIQLIFNALFGKITRYNRKTDQERRPQENPKNVAVFWHGGIAYNIFNEPILEPDSSSEDESYNDFW